MNLPRARLGELVATQLEDEVVVYDPDRKQAHSLNQVASAVWHHCNGVNTIAELQRLVSDEIGVPLDQESVWLALRKLERAHLLVESLEPVGVTRRQVLGRAGQLVGASLAIPVVVSAFVPTAAAAASTDREPPESPEPEEPEGPGEPGDVGDIGDFGDSDDSGNAENSPNLR
jgi:hypothetical protein